MSEAQQAQAAYRQLLENGDGAHLATLDADGRPQASYAPCIWHAGDCFLFLSRLSGHCGNLQRDPRLGLMLLEDAAQAANAFARQRVSLQGRAQIVARDDARFARVLECFHQRFGEIMQVLEALPDFHLFRVVAESGSFVRGFGQAYTLEGEGLERLRHIDPRE